MKNKYAVGDIIICQRVSPNLGGKGYPGSHYRVLAVAPKVRVTPGTGPYFLFCQDLGTPGLRASFNVQDVRACRCLPPLAHAPQQ